MKEPLIIAFIILLPVFTPLNKAQAQAVTDVSSVKMLFFDIHSPQSGCDISFVFIRSDSALIVSPNDEETFIEELITPPHPDGTTYCCECKYEHEVIKMAADDIQVLDSIFLNFDQNDKVQVIQDLESIYAAMFDYTIISNDMKLINFQTVNFMTKNQHLILRLFYRFLSDKNKHDFKKAFKLLFRKE